ncbi:MAG: transposase [Rhodospirillales bacterium]|nr:transposase [Rhodospirillales bacterium]
MTDEEAEAAFRNLRWKNGEPHCPHRGCVTVMSAAGPPGSWGFAARRAAATSPSPAVPCSPPTRCRCGTTSRPSRSSSTR